jgi:hypothetical protein
LSRPENLGSSACTTARARQREWAERRGIEIDSAAYVLRLNDNFFQDLSSDSRAEFSDADGGELGVPGIRGKMQALHSSSALACNVFEYWRERNASCLESALGLSSAIDGVRFERKFPTGLPGAAPNLDVVLELNDGSFAAIESKFLEPYYGRHAPGFKTKYFEDDQRRWETVGYPNCQRLAEALNSSEDEYRWLHAEQLLKHILGLGASGRKWELIYLWYDAADAAASGHSAEVDRFAEVVTTDGIQFRSMTYQTLFAAIESRAGDSERLYVDYLRDRYFGA